VLVRALAQVDESRVGRDGPRVGPVGGGQGKERGDHLAKGRGKAGPFPSGLLPRRGQNVRRADVWTPTDEPTDTKSQLSIFLVPRADLTS
jgi:hypothetical protein